MGNSVSLPPTSVLYDQWPQVAASLVLATGIYYLMFYRSRRGGSSGGIVGGVVGSFFTNNKPPTGYASTSALPPSTVASVSSLASAMACQESDATQLLKDLHQMWTRDRTIGFSNENADHEQYLKTLFNVTTIPSSAKKIVEDGYVRRSSELWGLLGFQGEDPATDLRGGGMLSLHQYAVFCTTSKMIMMKNRSGTTSSDVVKMDDDTTSEQVVSLSRRITEILTTPRAIAGGGGSTSPSLSLLEVLDVVIADSLKKVKPLVTRVPSSHPKPIPAATTASSTARGGLHDGIVLFNSREHSGGGSSWYLEACVSIQFTVQVLQDAVRKLHPLIEIVTPSSGVVDTASTTATSAEEQEQPQKKKTLLRKVQPATDASSLSQPTSPTSFKLPNPSTPSDVVLSSEMLRFLFTTTSGDDDGHEGAEDNNMLAVRVGVLHYVLFATMHALWVRQRPHVMEYQTFMQENFATHGIEIVSRALWHYRI